MKQITLIGATASAPIIHEGISYFSHKGRNYCMIPNDFSEPFEINGVMAVSHSTKRDIIELKYNAVAAQRVPSALLDIQSIAKIYEIF